ncbi:histidine kinase [Rhizobacter sp. Root404]|nr:histidine kinase [Rhizobacter sp. Root404]
MLHEFLTNNRSELIGRCRKKVRRRLQRNATDMQLVNGIPLFLDQLIRTLIAEDEGNAALSVEVSGRSGGDVDAPSEIGVGAMAHGKALLGLGFSVDQVVHDYGDLCQAITELAEEGDAPFQVPEFRTLNRCLDNAIADAVSEFSSQRDSAVAERLSTEANERLAYLAHELRNALQVANLSVRAMEIGSLSLAGATGSVLKRSLTSMRALVDSSLAEVRARSPMAIPTSIFSLSSLIIDAATAAQLEADVRGCELIVATVDPVLRVEANRDLLLGALGNLLSNAFKFTHRDTAVHLIAYDIDDRVYIDVEDHCGGLASNHAETMFLPFTQLSADRTGLGLGLSIARQNVESMGGTLSVKDLPQVGCVFTISFPSSLVERRSDLGQLG